MILSKTTLLNFSAAFRQLALSEGLYIVAMTAITITAIVPKGVAADTHDLGLYNTTTGSTKAINTQETRTKAFEHDGYERTDVNNEVDDFNDSDLPANDLINSDIPINPNLTHDEAYQNPYVHGSFDNTATITNINQTYTTQTVQTSSTGEGLNVFEQRILQDTLDDNLLVKNVPLNAVSPETLKTFVQVIDLVRRDYVEPVSDEVLFSDAISGMLEKLDSHAEFLDADAYDNLRAFTEGDIGHVGLSVEYSDSASEWIIQEVAPNSPAQLSGLQAGDYLHKINDIKLNAGMQDSDIAQLLSGIAGTLVDVEVSKAGRGKKVVTLQRNIAKHQQLGVEVIGSVVYIKLPVFQNDTALQMIELLEALDTPITGILIDVRNNPGGVLTSAVEVASLFMDDTDVVQIHGRDKPIKILSTQGVPVLKDLPVVILQNRYSASASEVLASSMQINNRAIITGEPSHGKGSIQAILPLDDTQAIKLTVAHYFGADGREIEGVGVTPDVALPENQVTLWKQQALALLLEQDRPLGIIFNSAQEGIATQENY